VPNDAYRVVPLFNPDVVLTAGSDLTVVAESGGPLPYPGPMISTWTRRLFKGSWIPNTLRQVFARNVPANFGSVGGKTSWYYRGREFAAAGNAPMWTYPFAGSVNKGGANGPMWNNALPIVYGLRVVDPGSQAQLSDLIQYEVVQQGPANFQPANPASLAETIL
jgi:hypothetical protein